MPPVSTTLARLRPGVQLALVVLRESGPALTARLLPAVTAIGFLLVQFATVIDWGGIRSWLAEISALERTGLALVLAAVSAVSFASTVRALVVDRPALRPWWRSGLGEVARGIAIAPILAATVAPVALAAALWPGPPMVSVALRVVASLPLVFAVSRVVPGRAAGSGAGPALAAGGFSLAELAHSALWPTSSAADLCLLVLVACSAVVACGRMHAGATTGNVVPTPGLAERVVAGLVARRPRTALGALVWRDAIALARTDPGVLALALLPVVPLAVLLHGLTVRGGGGAPELRTALAVMACACAPIGGAWLGRVLAALGRQLDPPRWPVRPSLRAASLCLVALAAFGPTGTALAATAVAATSSFADGAPLAAGAGSVGAGAESFGAGGESFGAGGESFGAGAESLGGGALSLAAGALRAIAGMVLAAAGCAAGAAWIAAWPRPGRRRPFNVGVHLAWVLAVLLLSLGRAPATRVAQAGMGVVAMMGATAALARGRRTLPLATALEGG